MLYPHLKSLDFSQMSFFSLLQPPPLCILLLDELHLPGLQRSTAEWKMRYIYLQHAVIILNVLLTGKIKRLKCVLEYTFSPSSVKSPPLLCGAGLSYR